jgi:hypothetical protein
VEANHAEKTAMVEERRAVERPMRYRPEQMARLLLLKLA